MTKEEINTIKIIKHNLEMQKAMKLKDKYESLPSTDAFWVNFHQREYERLLKHLKASLPANLMVNEDNYSQINFDLMYDLCYLDRFSKEDGIYNSTMAWNKLNELVSTKKYICFNIMGISSRGGGPKWDHVIRAYRYEADVDWFRDGHILKLKNLISTKKSAITLLSKKLTKPLSEVLDQSPKNPFIPPELKQGMVFPIINKIDWTQYEPGKFSESDMESSVLVSPKDWGFENWFPVAQQLSLSENGRIDALLGNDQGQLLLIELQRGSLDKDHYSKISVYRRQLARDWKIDPKSIGMVLIANSCNQAIQDCCEEFNIQLVLKTPDKVLPLVKSARELWEKSQPEIISPVKLSFIS